MHLYTGEHEFNGTHGKIWLTSTLCNKYLRDARRATKNRARVTCPKCRRRMEQDDALWHWLGMDSDEDFEMAHAPTHGYVRGGMGQHYDGSLDGGP